jgi:hypothetical protein
VIREAAAAERPGPCRGHFALALDGEKNRVDSLTSRRDEARMPVEYPHALKPQSWAAGAPLLMGRTLLGLDATGGKMRQSPHVPESLGKIRLR